MNLTKIQLKSRGNNQNYLEKIKDKEYLLKTPYNVRMGYTSKDKTFVDPSGGPMMVEGDFLKEAQAVIKSIKAVKGVGIVITFES